MNTLFYQDALNKSFGQSRVADLLEPRLSCNKWQKTFNAISSKHFGFVICKTDTCPNLFCSLYLIQNTLKGRFSENSISA